MRFLSIYIIVFFVLNSSCNNTTDQKPEDYPKESAISKTITQDDIESFRFDDYGLSDDSRVAIENWQKYWELNDQVEFINKADFSFFKTEKNVLKTFINDFKTEMPETIKTAPILSRITALETKLLKLNSILKLDNIDKATQLEAVKEYLIAMSNLNLQMNKKFEFDANLIDKNDVDETPDLN